VQKIVVPARDTRKDKYTSQYPMEQASESFVLLAAVNNDINQQVNDNQRC
jgi:hypothetical protein